MRMSVDRDSNHRLAYNNIFHTFVWHEISTEFVLMGHITSTNDYRVYTL